MEWARLNVFQRLTRQWDSVHPYNAGQAMKLAGTAEVDRCIAAYQSTVHDVGLGSVEAERGRFRWTPSDSSIQPEILQGTSLDELMTRELNRPFPAGPQVPFRPFIVQENAAFFAGVVYHHWVADSSSIRMLLHEWFLRLYEPARARRQSLRIATDGYWKLFGPDQTGWRLDEGVISVFRWSTKFRRARRIDPEGFRDLRSNFSLHHAKDGLIKEVAAAAKRQGVTVNDVFLAAMAEVCDTLVPARRTPRRLDLGLGTIVDLRRNAKRPMMDEFGLFLGFTSVFCRPEDLADWQRLLMRVHQQNAMQKRSFAAESSMVRMLAGLVAARVLKKRKLLEFYRKRLALAAGISNVNLTREWVGKYHPAPLLDYIRISPAGPMMPVVFTPTTLGSQLNLGLTCRDSVIPTTLAPRLAKMFFERLGRFSQEF